jgi:hypothetical protein
MYMLPGCRNPHHLRRTKQNHDSYARELRYVHYRADGTISPVYINATGVGAYDVSLGNPIEAENFFRAENAVKVRVNPSHIVLCCHRVACTLSERPACLHDSSFCCSRAASTTMCAASCRTQPPTCSLPLALLSDRPAPHLHRWTSEVLGLSIPRTMDLRSTLTETTKTPTAEVGVAAAIAATTGAAATTACCTTLTFAASTLP